MGTTIPGPDGRPRCRWCGAAPEFLAYHDAEWGFPVADDRHLFEKLSLEGFQAGLSWRTILAKRENFRAAFHEFDFDRIARFTERDVARLLRDEGSGPPIQQFAGAGILMPGDALLRIRIVRRPVRPQASPDRL
jgi:DNA-3-methyladenine glycosylase I